MITLRFSWSVLSAGAAAIAIVAMAGLRRKRRRRASRPSRLVEVENRKSDRTALVVPVTVKRFLRTGELEVRVLWSKDVSEDGILLVSESPAVLGLGETVALEIGQGEAGADLGKAVVARVDSEYDARGTFLRCAYGLKFLVPGPRAQRMRGREGSAR